jgi:diguanylate cyclase (GGDEF)-like protein
MSAYDIPSAWRDKLDALKYALQPIVNIRNGVVFGYEALLRGIEPAGFETIIQVFDRACEDGILPGVDLELRTKAMEAFTILPWHGESNLFYNMDTRIWTMPEHSFQRSIEVFQQTGFPNDSFCFEVSEIPPANPALVPAKVWHSIKEQGFKIAVDDCGVGFAGMQLLYHTEPHLIKIDRFFISDLAEHPKKRIFVSNLVNIAHRMGALVVAEGVETEREVFYCKEIGCDLLQGFYIERPQIESSKLQRQYEHIADIERRDRRRYDSDDKKFIEGQLIKTEPVFHDGKPFSVFKRFKDPNELRVIPVVNHMNEPLGVITEDTLKPFAYSDYGRYLLQNPALGKKVQDFITPNPIADLRTSVDNILELYVQDESVRGVTITDQMQYVGMLDARALLRALNERNLAQARDQNPLSKLPGNLMINKFLASALGETETYQILVYFDLDNFKPYNDRYGFRNGDRVITLFSDILRHNQNKHGYFVGHVGGDDFFVGIRGWKLDEATQQVSNIQYKFKQDVQSFYSREDRQKGCIMEKDREGVMRSFPPFDRERGTDGTQPQQR